MFFNDLNLNKQDKLYLFLLTIFILVITYRLMDFQMSGGIYSPDESLYLISAFKYAGLDYYNICDVNDLFYTPVISYLTSLLLRLGIDGHFSISFVTAIFGIFSIYGMYVLLKNRFTPLLCLTGSILFGSFTIFLLNFASGLIDIPGVSVSIWMMIFGIIAIDNNPKYFYILFPLTVVGFFTRYTSIFTLPIIFLYYLIKRDIISEIDNFISDRSLFNHKMKGYFKSSEFKIIFSSILISVIFTILLCKFTLFDYNAKLGFFDLSAVTLHVSNTNTNAIDYNGSKLFYIFGLLNDFSFGFVRDFNFELNFLIYFIMFCGLIFKLINLVFNFNSLKNFKSNFKTKYLNIVLSVLMIFSVIMSFIEFKYLLNHLISNIFFCISILLFFSLVKEFKINEDLQSLNLIMFSWFCVYFIFISLYPIKTYRYALPFLPSIVYFVIYGLDSILETIIFGFGKKINKKEINLKYSYLNCTKIIPIVLILIFVISSFSHIACWEIEENPVASIAHINNKGYINDLVNVTDYIKINDPDYHSKPFGCYGHPSRMIRYYLQTNITFADNDAKLIDSSGVDYVIINEKINFNNFHEIYNCGEYYLYYHN